MKFNKSILSDLNSNDIRFSSVNQYQDTVNFANFSAKLVLSGKENYTINSKNTTLTSGEYIIGNHHTSATIVIDGKEITNGICVDISSKSICEIIDYKYKNPDSFKRFLFEKEWSVKKFNAKDTHLGKAFNQLVNKYDAIKNGEIILTNEIFIHLAECVVLDSQIFYKHYNNLSQAKIETNDRLIKFLYEAKFYIDNHYLESINIDEIAKASSLSTYHFIRLFKKVFHLTPYQYLIQKRLDFAKLQLETNSSINEIAYLIGFSTPGNFSRAYKNYFGVTPKNDCIKNSNF